MKLLVTGGTGFIGGPLCQVLAQHGHELIVLSRRPERHVSHDGITILPWETSAWQQRAAGCDGIINLAGESLAAKRWTPQQKRLIRESRLETTHRLVSAMVGLPNKPAVFINASAVGYYGACSDEPLTETEPPGHGFLAELCQAWEAEARRAEALGVRVVRLRLGLVLGPGGGALAKMVPPFRLFVGGPLGSGRQWVSWIHRDDVVGLIEWALTTPGVTGAVNATAPSPVTMRALCRSLGQVLHRPSWAPVPSFVLRALLGEMADLLLTGQRVIPAAAERLGYRFQFADVDHALAAALA